MTQFKFALAFLVLLGLAACAGPTASPQATATNPPATTLAPTHANTAAPSRTPEPVASATMPAARATNAPTAASTFDATVTEPTADDLAQIQNALNTIARAYTTGDASLLDNAVEQNSAFARMVRSDFADYQKSFVGGEIEFAYQLLSAKPRPYGFIQAEIQNQYGMVSHWLFRKQGDKWVLGEPSVSQLGKPQTIETEHFIFTTYPWADNVNGEIMQLMENGRTRVKNVLGQAPDTKAYVEIRPTYGVSPFDDPFAVAAYSTNGRGTRDEIWIYSPESFQFGAYDPSEGWQATLETILTHEYTHLVHKRVFDRAGQQCAWTSEGLAEYVAGSFREYAVRSAVRSGNIIPLVDNDTPVYKQDLNHMTLLKQDKALAYGFAAALVKFITEKYGGLDGFWKLAKTCDTNYDFNVSLQQAFGVSLDQFDREWRKYLETY